MSPDLKSDEPRLMSHFGVKKFLCLGKKLELKKLFYYFFCSETELKTGYNPQVNRVTGLKDCYFNKIEIILHYQYFSWSYSTSVQF